MRRRHVAALLALLPLDPLLLALLPLACADRAEPARVVALEAKVHRGGRLSGAVDRVVDERGVWLAYTLRRDDFTPFVPGIWRAPRLAAGEGRPADGGAAVQRVGGGEVSDGLSLREAAHDAIPIGAFAVAGGWLYLRADDLSEWPEAAEVREHVRGAGASAVGRARVAGFAGDGVLLLAGDALEARLPAGPARVLRATTACAPYPPGPAPPAVFRVLCDGAEVARLEQAVGAGASATARAVALPAGARELRVELEGPAVLAGLFEPRLTLADAPAPDERRPDLIVFLADTFRADNLACHGGDPRIAPSLNALARESVRFLRAWSPASWTLPSHAALFSGLHPHQSTVTRGSSALPPEIESLAERFAAAGYRTGAVTDAGCVSAAFGLDQGFAWFDEHWSSPERTLAAVDRFLDGDDGRPLLLFVQSYRAHAPYVVGPRAAAQVGAPESGGQRSRDLMARLRALDPAAARDVLGGAAREDALALEALYRGASAELDALFGELRARLERRGLGGAYLVVASDHGEAFLEHGLVEHGNGAYEELLRVPLLLHGPGLSPAERLDAASLVDLPRTLAELAGIAPARGWGGRSLLAPPAVDPAAFAFECDLAGGPTTVAVVDGPLKMIAPLEERPGPPAEVFDLSADPLEAADVVLDPARWRARWDAREPELRELLAPRARTADAQLGSGELALLRAMGYAGD